MVESLSAAGCSLVAAGTRISHPRIPHVQEVAGRPEASSKKPEAVLSPAMNRRTKAAGVIAAALLLGAWASNGYFRAAAFVIQAAGTQGYARRAAAVETGEFDERARTIPWRGGQLRPRL